MNKFKTYKDLDEHSIERWAKELDSQPKKSLTEEECEALVLCMSREKEIERPDDQLFDDLISGWNGVSIIHKRLQVHSFTMTKASVIFCGMMVDSPGKAVMMLNYIQYKCCLHGIKHVDVNSLGLHVIPMGWFGEDVLKQAWDNQKYISEDGSLCNMLDDPEYMKSIRGIQEVRMYP